jgi:hypothetical protein
MDICIHIIVIHFILSRIWQQIPLKNVVKSIDHWLINDNGEIKFLEFKHRRNDNPWIWKNSSHGGCDFLTWFSHDGKKIFEIKKGNSWYPLLQSLNLNTTILYNIMYLCYHDYHFRFLCDHLYVLMMLFIIAIYYVIFLPLDFLWYPFVIDFL